MTAYFDANAIIDSIEGDISLRNAVLTEITSIESSSGLIATSRLSRLECRVKPLREQRFDLLEAYELFFSRQGVALLEVTDAIIEHATGLRAKYNLRTPDAIHIASAIESQAQFILTGDQKLQQCREIAVKVI